MNRNGHMNTTIHFQGFIQWGAPKTPSFPSPKRKGKKEKRREREREEGESVYVFRAMIYLINLRLAEHQTKIHNISVSLRYGI